MFCPVCKSEYRLGFTHCADCDADLVEHLPASDAAATTAGQNSVDLDAPELLWSGVDTGAFAQIRAALDSAAIPYNDEPLEARLLYASLRNPLEIWIQRVDHDRAHKILTELFGEEPATTESEANPADLPDSRERIGLHRSATNLGGAPDYSTTQEEPEAAPSNVADDIAEDFDPHEATVEVWSGEDGHMAEIVKSCLRENGIGCEIPEGGVPARVLVQPQHKTRAREIVREITEGASPA
jgi:hypothetical protein